MKKNYILSGLMLIAALSLASCAKEQFVEQPAEKAGVPFEIVAGVDTKTTTADGATINWADGDKLNVFHAPAGTTTYGSNDGFEFQSGNSFSGTLADGALTEAAYDWYVLYPYNSKVVTPANTTAGYTSIGSSSATKAQVQTGYNSKAHLAGKYFPLYGKAENVAKGDKPSISLNQALSVIRITVKNGKDAPLTVSSISFTAPESIVGSYFINFAGNTPVFTESDPAYVSNVVSLTVNNGTELAKDATADFYIAVKPFTAKVNDDITLSVNGFERTVKITDADVTFAPGKIKTLAFNYKPADAAPISTDTDVVVGFEAAEGFDASTSYGNTDIKYQGNSGMRWGIVSGSSISTSAKISGEQSMLLRDYTANSFHPYAVTDYRLSSVAYVSFKAKTTSAGYKIKLSYTTDNGNTWNDAETYTLGTDADDYSHVFEPALTNASFKFTVDFPTTRVNKKDVIFDDVVFSKTAPVVHEITLGNLEAGNKIHIGALAGAATFTVTSDVAWTATKSNDDFDIDPKQGGSGETEVEVTGDDNTGAERQLGTITITNGTDTKTVYVWQDAAAIVNDGSLEHPYTASEAKTLALNGDTGSYYITGTVTKIQNQFSASYGTANFWIDENATAEDVFEGYKIKYFGNVKWVEGNALIAVGDVVIIYGKLTVYNTTVAETSEGYLVSLNGKTKALTVPSLTVTPNNANKQITVAWGAATGSDQTITYTVTCGDQTLTPAPTAAGSHTFTMANYGTYEVSVVATATDAISATASTEATLSNSTELESETIDFSKLSLTNAKQYSDPFNGGHFTITFAGGGNDGKYYTTGTGIRTYGGGTVTVESSLDIKKVEFTWDGSYAPTAASVADVGTYTVGTHTWTGSAKKIELTRPTGSGHWRLQKVKVYYK